jgi:hypothetical protein
MEMGWDGDDAGSGYGISYRIQMYSMYVLCTPR